MNVEAGIPASSGFEDAENGMHHAAPVSCASSVCCSALLVYSCVGGSSAARVTLNHFQFSADIDALPW